MNILSEMLLHVVQCWVNDKAVSPTFSAAKGAAGVSVLKYALDFGQRQQLKLLS
jgi:hypothetical protein